MVSRKEEGSCLSITKKEAAKYIEEYFKTYPGIKRFLDSAVDFSKENGFRWSCRTATSTNVVERNNKEL